MKTNGAGDTPRSEHLRQADSADAPPRYTRRQRKILLDLARRSIRAGVKGERLVVEAQEYDAPLRHPRATFVTLHLQGHLRGCIGTTEAAVPLVMSVIDNAYQAAFADPRFPPITATEAAEAARLTVHIAALTPPAEIAFHDEADLAARLRPGIDGLIIRRDARHATFLPAVWESIREPRAFVRHLKQKAGIEEDEETERAWVYQTESFGD